MGPEWLSAIASLVGAAGWPIAIVAIVLILRQELSRLMARVEGLDIGGSKLSFTREFEDKLERAEQTFSDAEESPDVGVFEAELDPTIAEMAQKDPWGAMWLVWEQVRDAVGDLARARGVQVDLRSMRQTGAKLHEAGLMSSELADTVQQLHSSYKRVARKEVFDLDNASVVKYLRLAIDTRDAVKSLVREPARTA